jgi:hypothetical protein
MEGELAFTLRGTCLTKEILLSLICNYINMGFRLVSLCNLLDK